MAARAITLGEASLGEFIDLTTTDGETFYRNGMKALEGEKYDGKPSRLRTFLSTFGAKAKMYGWDDVLNVPDSTPAATPRNILTNYVRITMEECRAHAEGYMLVRERAAQNSMMIYNCIDGSLSLEFKKSLVVESEKYMIDGYGEGLCFLKLILSKAQTHTIATVNMLRASIINLPSKIVELAGNIVEFNNHVRSIENAIASYGQRSDELLINVILAYEEVEDEDFVNCVKMKKYIWEEGQTTLELHGLLKNVENYYNIRVQQGKWKAPSKQGELLAALKALVQQKEKQSDHMDSKITYDERKKKDKENNPWKYVAPKAGEPTTQTRNRQMWHWCTTHQRWTGHTSEECEGIGVNMRNQNNRNNRGDNNKGGKKMQQKQNCT